MTLPSSGPLGASDINSEAGRSSSANAPLSGSSSTPQNGSLVKLYQYSNVNQNAPHSYSEFYGKTYSSGATLTSFLSGPSNTSSSDDACIELSSTVTYYHDGSGTYPAVGDKVYSTNATTNPLNGGSGTWWPAFPSGPQPAAQAFRITGSTGTVQSVAVCPPP